jgi:hypothetical protein
MIEVTGVNLPPPRSKGGRTVFHSRMMFVLGALELFFD